MLVIQNQNNMHTVYGVTPSLNKSHLRNASSHIQITFLDNHKPLSYVHIYINMIIIPNIYYKQSLQKVIS